MCGIRFLFLITEPADVLSMPPLPRDAGAPAVAPMARARGAFPTGPFIERATGRSRETIRAVCAKGSDGSRSRGAAGHANDDKGCVEERESRKQTLAVCNRSVRLRRGVARR